MTIETDALPPLGGKLFHFATTPHGTISVHSYKTNTTMEYLSQDAAALVDSLVGISRSGGLGLLVLADS